jgi:hypothetical protein
MAISESGEPVFVVAKDLADAGLPAFFGDKAASTGSIKLSQLVPFDPQASVGTDFVERGSRHPC